MSKQNRNVPFLSKIEMSPFFGFAVGSFVELARSEALRSPKGAALRAQRRASSTLDRHSPWRADFPTTPLFRRRISLWERLGATVSDSLDS